MDTRPIASVQSSGAEQARRQVKPFLKWAGGKRQLLPQLRTFYPRDFNRYLEPFVGSGAVFFDLYSAGLLGGRQAVLVDSNADLIGCYSVLKNDPESVIVALEEMSVAYRRRSDSYFYEIRDRRFNPERLAFFSSKRRSRNEYPANLAAMLIFLNRTGFNGLFRLNSRGEFNVPAGRYKNPQICDSENLRGVSRALNDTNVTLVHGQFDQVEGLVDSGDFLYFDPPYAPVSRTANFTSYTAEQFGTAEQRRLHALTIRLARKGCFVVVSNSTAREIKELYDSTATVESGLRALRVKARRAINSNPTRRGDVEEYLLVSRNISRLPEASH